jgi:DNA-binding GntR family transcriptional regulator
MPKNTYKTGLLTDQVYDKLETDILSGKYPRGTVLTELGLAKELGVSRTPIRDALHRLSQERLIEDTLRGSIVLGITAQDVRDIMDIRYLLEGLACRYAAEKLTPEGAAEMRRIIDLQDYYAEKGDTERVSEMDDLFHMEICRQCGSLLLADALLPLHSRIQKYRRASMSHQERLPVISTEHRKIYEAICAGDSALAERLGQEHVKNAKERMAKEGNQ